MKSFDRLQWQGVTVAALLLSSCNAPGATPGNLPYSLPAPVAAQRSPGLSKIYVANSGEDSGAAASVLVFARRADGDVAPERTIAGSNTGMINPDGIAVDAAGRIYVADPFAATSGAVLIFGPNADGNAAPIATITDGTYLTSGVALDSQQNVYTCNFEQGKINVFAAKTYQLIRTFYSDYGTHCTDLAVDPPGNVYVLVGGYSGGMRLRSSGSGSYGGLIAVFPAGASGNTKPIRVVSGRKTGLNDPGSIAIDSQGRAYVTSYDKSGEILVFAAGANGDARPLWRLRGRQTRLTVPDSVAVDERGSIYTSNDSFKNRQSLTVFPPGARGDVQPIRRISGAKTQLLEIHTIAVR
jgi:sugar lactone lactonase YvrE